MTLILRDSINAPLIPRDTPVVAGYGDGRYIWSPSWLDGSNWFDLFPNSTHLVIVVNAAHAGDVLDVETGDATPDEVPGWCDRFDRPGRRAPTVYCNRSTWPLVQQAVGNRRVDYWIGTLDGTQDVPGAVAVQYIDTGAYDESVIHDPSWAGVDMAQLDDIQKTVNQVYWQLQNGFDGPGGTGDHYSYLKDVPAVLAHLAGNSDQLVQTVNAQSAAISAAKAEADATLAALQALQAAGVPPASLQPVLDSLAKLAAHLGAGTP